MSHDSTKRHTEVGGDPLFVAALDGTLSESIATRCLGVLDLVKWRTRTACVAITNIDPASHKARIIAQSDVPPEVADFLVSPAFLRGSAALQRQLTDVHRLNAWDDVGFPDTVEADRAFSSSGFRNGVSLPLVSQTGALVGMVHANTTAPHFAASSREVYLGLRTAFTELVTAATALQSARLTRREKEVLRLLRDGLTNAQIALRLSVAERTVATHVEHILQKVGAGNRVEAAVWSCRVGL